MHVYCSHVRYSCLDHSEPPSHNTVLGTQPRPSQELGDGAGILADLGPQATEAATA